jgi:hypothetical protein
VDNCDSEKIKLTTNEFLLRSRGFVLVGVDDAGSLMTAYDMNELSQLEQSGMVKLLENTAIEIETKYMDSDD